MRCLHQLLLHRLTTAVVQHVGAISSAQRRRQLLGAVEDEFGDVWKAARELCQGGQHGAAIGGVKVGHVFGHVGAHAVQKRPWDDAEGHRCP